ncbi:hypothetical protein PUNSTDRAFT_134494 [Punctularia strigosozonata HHB-11173 SS5]|uniref:uncharacterized protein n=1 Tax=Punctularia strigosozonata (strain HHB-11173) TaxID=741275 RepID=UPI0004417733|nr:uncharacterized protein PUNSTDRAFT_134494 [Punctularia strigosozonata HHB-11173 SS5]EIN09341.1 hypothetical protein PUNSTDRAFT_134494 [Punctularia strigosozonata HHB-11173 SS5]
MSSTATPDDTPLGPFPYTLTVRLPKRTSPSPEPDPLNSPWYRYFISPNQDDYSKRETFKALSTFVPFRHLPPELDTLSTVQKPQPPGLLLAIPLEHDTILSYATKRGLEVYISKKTFDLATAAEKDNPDVIKSTVSTLHCVLGYLRDCLWSELRFRCGYGRPDPTNPFLPLWVLCSNYDPVDDRPTEEELSLIREELGLDDDIKWYLAVTA